MAQKVKKKYINDAAVDASKILFMNEQVLKSESSSGGTVDIFKVNAQNKIEFLGGILSMAGTDANSVVVKSQMESAISAERSVRQAAEAILQGNIDAEALLRGSEDVRILGEAKNYADAKDVINLAAAKAYCEAQDVINLASAKTYAEEKANAAEAAAKLYADNLNSAMNTRVTSLETDVVKKTYVDTQDAALGVRIDSEAATRASADTALGNRISPLESRSMYGNSFIYNDVIPGTTPSDQPGIEDPSALKRDGWYFKNSTAGQGISWYFYDKTTSQSGNIAKSGFSAFAVMTFDAVAAAGAKPIIGLYSSATGSGDAVPGFYHSKWVYQLSTANLNSIAAGKKVLLYIGSDPSIHPELQHIQLDYIAGSSAGPRLDSEVIGFSSFLSDSSTAVNKVQWMVESLGVDSSSYKMKTQLRIHYAQKSSLDAEISRAQAAEATLTTSVNNEASTRAAADTAEAAARAAADLLLMPLSGARAMTGDMNMGSHKITGLSNGSASSDAVNKGQLDAAVAGVVQKTYVDAQDDAKLVEAKAYADTKDAEKLVEAKAYTDSKVGDEQSARQLADQGLSNRIAILEQDPTTKSYVDGLNSAEIAARESAVSGLDARIDVLEQDPTTKAYVDGKISDLINGAPEALNTLNEIAAQLANDESVVAALTNSVANNLQSAKDYADAGILVEKNRAMGVEGDHESRIAILEQDPTTKSYVDGEIADLSASAHSELEAAIAQEVLDRNAAIAVETGNRETADSVLSGRLDALEADSTTKTYVDGKVLEEQLARENMDSIIGGRLDSLEDDVVKKTYVDGKFSSEQSARESADGVINGRLDALENDAVKKAYVDSQDQYYSSQAESYANSVVLLEKNRAEGIEAGLRSDLNAEISNAQSREAQVLLDAKAYSDIEKNARISDVNSLDVRLSVLEEDSTTKTYVDGLISDVTAGYGAAIDALDESTNGRLEILEADPTTKTYVDDAIAALAGSGGSAVQQVADDLAQEISDREAAVSNEAAARVQGDSDTLASAQSYADQKISELVNSAPGMLDTLKELADAIGDDPNFAATVASQVNDVHNEVMALKGAVVFRKESFMLSSTDMSNGYIEMSYEAASNSMNAFTEGLAIHEGIDYSLSVVGGKTRMSLDSGDFASGDKVYVQYFTKLA
jgi:hypothetical protein